MRALVTGSAGHLGEALMRTLTERGEPVAGLDTKASEFTHHLGSITDSSLVRAALEDVDTVFHAATLHKPHVVTHTKQAFVDTNVTGTLVLLEAALAAGVRAFVFTSSTSAFGYALRPPQRAPAAWVTEALAPVPRNIYGVTKLAAESLCELFHRRHGLNCLVLRTSRFFPEPDDDRAVREAFEADNARVNELLFRRADIADMVSALLCAADRAPELGFGRYIITATSPFLPADLEALRTDAPAVLARRVPAYADIYRERGWRMFDAIDRVYVNDAARQALGWTPAHGFDWALERLAAGRATSSALARAVGTKPYHEQKFEDGPYPVD